MNVLITGGSHVRALSAGFDAVKKNSGIPENVNCRILPLGSGLSVAGEFFSHQGDHIEITKASFRKNISRLPPDDFPCDAIGLSTALYSRPIWGIQDDWGKFGIPPWHLGKAPISSALLRRVIEEDHRHILDLLSCLSNLGVKVFVIEGPRPFRHNPEVRKVGVETVAHIDKRYREITVEKLDSMQIPIIGLPAHTYDSQGFMLDTYRHEKANDGTHGNTVFGTLMFKKVIAFTNNRQVYN